MSKGWEITDSKPDSFNIGFLGMGDITIVDVFNGERNEKRQVAVWTGSEEDMKREVGEAISKGNFLL